MFDFNDEDEEKKRAKWYAPLGEFMLLFSNIEFTCAEWIDMLGDSKVMSNHIKGLWSFEKRVGLIIKLIPEYDVSEDKKKLWLELWESVNSKIPLRNTVAHNPPFDNHRIEFDSNLIAKDINRVIEIHHLSKSLGVPGSGVTLEKLLNCNSELRKILIALDYESSGEAGRYCY